MRTERTTYECDWRLCASEERTDDTYSGPPDKWVTLHGPRASPYDIDNGTRHYCCLAHAAVACADRVELGDLVDAASGE